MDVKICKSFVLEVENPETAQHYIQKMISNIMYGAESEANADVP